MPVYRFVCQDCGEQFEKKLSFSDSDVKMLCPNGHQHVRRLFATPAIVFKGSGWYVNDHRKSSAGTEK
jgi:putative FmdB family regulatory protein